MENETKNQVDDEKDEVLNKDTEFQKWLSEHEKEDNERLMQFYDVWEIE